ncbi:MAG: GNAT family N-acetyltransferase [Methylibium sp.]|uniref:GNAT family N-acetyltransferase n=1 Tax=Methylibium sp. TaxID=2067992 RepID=UPI00185A599B|nr:GNAT family N-acetyltransferase [Methylibium sp.]MBA3599601.1 GNAT family N-acetyltransferase [Methylibium sp.]
MHIRHARDEDVPWLPAYVLGGFDTQGYQPTFDGVRTLIERCRTSGYALIAEHDEAPVGILGAVIVPFEWTQKSYISVIALRSTRPGAGSLLIRTLLEQARDTFVSHIGVTIENPDPRTDKMMRRFGQFRMLRTYVFENKE